MNATIWILAAILLVFVGMIILGRYAEHKRKHDIRARLFNVPCPGCQTLFGERTIAVVEKLSLDGLSSSADTLTAAYRVRCKNCGHWLVYEGER